MRLPVVLVDDSEHSSTADNQVGGLCFHDQRVVRLLVPSLSEDVEKVPLRNHRKMFVRSRNPGEVAETVRPRVELYANPLDPPRCTVDDHAAAGPALPLAGGALGPDEAARHFRVDAVAAHEQRPRR